MSFSDFIPSSQKTPLRVSDYSQYGGIHPDQVDCVATRPSDGLEWLHALPEAGYIKDFGAQDKDAAPIRDAALIDQSPKPVQQEASKVSWYSKVNWWIAVSLLILGLLPGLIYISCCVKNNAKSNIEEAPAVTKTPKKEAGTAFESREDEFRAPFYVSRSSVSSFQENKKALEAEVQSFVNLKSALLEKQGKLEELIPVVREMGFFERKKGGHPPSKDLQKELDKIPTQIEDINRRAREIANELRSDCMQHPEFKKVSHSHKGFPFRIYFGGSELGQGMIHDRYELMARNDLAFQININKKLMDWNKTGDIDPFGTSRAALAQGVLIQLAKRPKDLFTALSRKEGKLNPQTVDRTLVVRFQNSGTMLVERQVETNDGKRFQWNETVRFKDGSTLISRKVTEIKGA